MSYTSDALMGFALGSLLAIIVELYRTIHPHGRHR